MKRTVLAILAGFVLCTLVAGCGESSDDGVVAEPREPAAEKRTPPGPASAPETADTGETPPDDSGDE